MINDSKFTYVKLTRKEVKLLIEAFYNNTILNYIKDVPDKYLIDDIRIYNKLLKVIHGEGSYFRKNKLTLYEIKKLLKE